MKITKGVRGNASLITKLAVRRPVRDGDEHQVDQVDHSEGVKLSQKSHQDCAIEILPAVAVQSVPAIAVHQPDGAQPLIARPSNSPVCPKKTVSQRRRERRRKLKKFKSASAMVVDAEPLRKDIAVQTEVCDGSH